MSGNERPHSGFTRRSFLKTTAVAAGLAAVGTRPQPPSLQALAANYESGQDETKSEHVFCGVCAAIALALASSTSMFAITKS